MARDNTTIAAGEEWHEPWKPGEKAVPKLPAIPAEPVVTELVERLRRYRPNVTTIVLCQEAADTITRLEAEKAQGIATINSIASMCSERDATIARHEQTIKEINDVWGRDAALVTALQSERDRLRHILVAVTDELQAEIENSYYEKYGDHPAMQRRLDRDLSTVREARAALAGESDE
jgi:uncharacterized coiled-coil protein SlyX